MSDEFDGIKMYNDIESQRRIEELKNFHMTYADIVMTIFEINRTIPSTLAILSYIPADNSENVIVELRNVHLEKFMGRFCMARATGKRFYNWAKEVELRDGSKLGWEGRILNEYQYS